jgi:CRP/FNR family cyclic AMP-dependent transcriptional regulator
VIGQTHAPEQFDLHIDRLFRKELFNCRVMRLARHSHVYTCGNHDPMVYFVESGYVKVLLLSAEGKECLLTIHAAGDIFGELSLCGQTVRVDTAVAMRDVVLRQIPCRSFINTLQRESLMENLVRFLAVRVAEHQEVITSLLTANSEQRLAITLLRLARRLGKKNPRNLCIGQKISHEELAEMVGTTRPRIGVFLKRFRALGLVELNGERHLAIREEKLVEYLARLSSAEQNDFDTTRPLPPHVPRCGAWGTSEVQSTRP